MRKRIYELIEVAEEGNKLSKIYDVVMIFVIFISIIPLAFKEQTEIFRIIDKVTVSIFIIDYILRWITADFRLKKRCIFCYLSIYRNGIN